MARPLVNAITRSSHVFRYHNVDNAAVITANTTTTFPLLTSSDDPDYEVGGDFSTSCQCEEGAVVRGIDLNLNIAHGTAGTPFELMIAKDINANLTATTPASLFSNNPGSAIRELRKYAVCYKAFFMPTDKLEKNLRLRIRKSALRRIGQMHEDDVLRLWITNGHATINGSLQGWGKIYVAEN